jgi:hypothetical protein
MKRMALATLIAVMMVTPIAASSAKHPEDCKSYGPGQFKVGGDIPAGEYVLYPSDPDHPGFFFESKDANGDDNVNAGSFDYSAILTVTKGNYLELRNAFAVPAYENPIIDRTKPGFFKVGTHIKEGEHKVKIMEGEDTAFYFLYEDSTLQDIVSCDSFEGQAYMETETGQILELRNAVLEW